MYLMNPGFSFTVSDIALSSFLYPALNEEVIMARSVQAGGSSVTSPTTSAHFHIQPPHVCIILNKESFFFQISVFFQSLLPSLLLTSDILLTFNCSSPPPIAGIIPHLRPPRHTVCSPTMHLCFKTFPDPFGLLPLQTLLCLSFSVQLFVCFFCLSKITFIFFNFKPLKLA